MITQHKPPRVYMFVYAWDLWLKPNGQTYTVNYSVNPPWDYVICKTQGGYGVCEIQGSFRDEDEKLRGYITYTKVSKVFK